MSFEKDLYTTIFKKAEHHRDVLDVLGKINNIYYMFRELRFFFENQPQYTVDFNGARIPLYDLILKVEKENISFLNLHIYLDGVCIGNPCDGWCGTAIPDNIANYLIEIF